MPARKLLVPSTLPSVGVNATAVPPGERREARGAGQDSRDRGRGPAERRDGLSGREFLDPDRRSGAAR